MTFAEYQIQAFETALPTAKRLDYAVLGLCSESGERADKFKKAIRDGTFNEAAFLDEVGDVLWYAALLCSLKGVALEDIAKRNLEKLASRAQRNTITGSGDVR